MLLLLHTLPPPTCGAVLSSSTPYPLPLAPLRESVLEPEDPVYDSLEIPYCNGYETPLGERLEVHALMNIHIEEVDASG